MNRKAMRDSVRAAQRTAPMGAEGVQFDQGPDREDPRFAILRIRFPNTGWPVASYRDAAALERLRRFCATMLQGASAAALAGQRLVEHERRELADLVAAATRRPDITVAAVVRDWILTLEAHTQEPGVRQMRLTAELWPRGRGSVEADWVNVGAIVHGVGVPEIAAAPVTPAEQTGPNDALLWTWSAAVSGR